MREALSSLPMVAGMVEAPGVPPATVVPLGAVVAVFVAVVSSPPQAIASHETAETAASPAISQRRRWLAFDASLYPPECSSLVQAERISTSLTGV